MLKLIEITDASSTAYGAMEQLMIESFPSDEYRDLEELKSYVGPANPAFRPMVIVDDQGFVGILNYWDFGSWRYIEHFATLPTLRNGGYGRRALAEFFVQDGASPVVIEVEEPTDELTSRRVGFYSRNGFELLPDPYVQPAYKAGSNPLPMRIMVEGQGAPSFAEIERTLHQRVYGYFK